MLSGGGFRRDGRRFRCRYRSILGYQNHRDRGIGWGEVEAGWWSASNLIGDLVDKVKLYGDHGRLELKSGHPNRLS